MNIESMIVMHIHVYDINLTFLMSESAMQRVQDERV